MKHYTSTLAPDILPHCPFVFLRSNVCLPPFRAGSLRRRPGGSATVGTTSPRREPFIPIDQAPAGHTSTGDPPVPVGDSPTGRARRPLAKGPSLLGSGALPVPPGESPGGTGQWPTGIELSIETPGVGLPLPARDERGEGWGEGKSNKNATPLPGPLLLLRRKRGRKARTIPLIQWQWASGLCYPETNCQT